MPKRGHDDDEGSRDPPDVIQGRRRATVHPKFRANKLSSGEGATSKPSAFAGITSVFGTGAAGATVGGALSTPSGTPAFSFSNPSAGTTTAAPVGGGPTFSFGKPSTGTTAAAPVGSGPGFTFGVPSAGTTAAAPTGGGPAFGFGAPSAGTTAAAPAGRSQTAVSGGFSFPKAALANSAPTVPASIPPPENSRGFPSTAVVASPQPKTQSDTVSSSTVAETPNGVRAESGEKASAVTTEVATLSADAAFGEGITAAKGARLNKVFSIWVSHNVETNPAGNLERGMRDYVAYASEIRLRVQLSKYHESKAPAAGTAFKHPSMPPADVAPGPESPLLAVASTASVSTRSVSATPAPSTPLSAAPAHAIPAPAATPKPAAAPPAAVPTPAPAPPAFSFVSPSTLPPASAPSGNFSFNLPSVTSAVAPVGGAPSGAFSGGFNFKPPASGGGGFTSAAKSTFKGFQLPSRGAIAPPASAAEADEEAMPKEDPSKLQRAQGEEQEQIVHEVRAKLFRFKKDESAWSDMGVGVLRLMRHNSTDARRLVLRNDMGKVVLNVALYADMKVTATKNAIKFVANIVDLGPSSLMIKVKANGLSPLHAKVLEQIPAK